MNELRLDPLRQTWTAFSPSRAMPPQFLSRSSETAQTSPFTPGNEAFAPHTLFAASTAEKWQVRVVPNSGMVAKTLREMQLGKEVGVIVMAIRSAEGEMMFNPPADTAVRGGDHLIVMGRPKNLRALENLLAARRGA